MDEIQIIASGTLEKVDVIAQGVYGILYSAKGNDHDYAVKLSKVEKTTDFVASLREIDFLAKLRKHPLILRLVAISRGSPFGYRGTGDVEKKHGIYNSDKLYIITEKASYDGYSFLKSKVSYDYIKLTMVQTLLSLEYMHGHGIIHRDIKPNNLLWFRYGSDRHMKMCDFGISKHHCYQELNNPKMVTPLYRAPELLFKWSDYDFKADMWSLGCVFYELLSRESFINNDKDVATELLESILSKVSDIPTDDLLRDMMRSYVIVLNKNIQIRRKRISDILASKVDTKEFDANLGKLRDYSDMLENMLVVDPKRRFSATQCLNHKCFDDFRTYITDYRNMCKPFDIDIFNIKLSVGCRKERSIAAKHAVEIFNTRYKVDPLGNYTYNYSWYSHRILFQSIDLFDRFLEGYSNELADNLVELYYFTCLYMSIKYFLTMTQPCNFMSILPANLRHIDNLKVAEDFEWYMLGGCLKFSVYRPTLYEAADFFDIKLTENDVAKLLQTYVSCYIEGGSTKLFDLFAGIMGLNKVIIPEFYSNIIRGTASTMTPVSSVVSSAASPSSTVTTVTTTGMSPGQENTKIPIVSSAGPPVSGVEYVPTSGPTVQSSLLPTSHALHTVMPGQQTLRGAPSLKDLLR